MKSKEEKRERVRASSKAWYNANKEKSNAKSRAYYAANKERANLNNKAWNAANPGRARKTQRACLLKKKYGLTIEDYGRILKAQGGRCRICRRKPGKKMLAVDHNHQTGEVRALLCSKCNTGLGQFNEDLSLLLKAASYLEEYS